MENRPPPAAPDLAKGTVPLAKAPSSTWTYLVDDRPEQLGMVSIGLVFDPFSALLMGISMTWFATRKLVFKKSQNLK